MFHHTYHFANHPIKSHTTLVSATDLYLTEKGYGFVLPKNRLFQKDLQIPEVNAGLDPWYWLTKQDFINLQSSNDGVYALKNDDDFMPEGYIPLCFKCNVPHSGNYKLTITLKNFATKPTHVLIFSGRRRLMFSIDSLLPSESIKKTCILNVSDIIPRGMTLAFHDLTLDLTIMGHSICLTKIEIEECNAPTLYIAGDSTVTDQNTSYPYHPSYSYCGWAQMLSAFLKPEIALSNHAHSGLTSETFRSEGHYKIIETAIKPGDFFMFQFGHNDQKLPELAAYDGYTKCLTQYIHEVKEKGATPILVTPLARNTWFANGSYNDLLATYVDACKQIAQKEQIPLIDLHAFSMNFIKSIGLESAKAYFYPKDYTHTNDYGGYLMASFIAQEIHKLQISNLSSTILKTSTDDAFFKPIKTYPVPIAPTDYEDATPTIFNIPFTDIEDCTFKKEISYLTSLGIISNEGTHFNPHTLVTRVEVLNWIIKAVGFVPMNVYNDHYSDVIGHEWYAGTVEVAHQNAIVPIKLIASGNFYPLSNVTSEELVYFMLSSYKCRKQLTLSTNIISNPQPITNTYLLNSSMIEAAENTFNLSYKECTDIKPLTKEEAIYYISKLYTSLQ